jgi:hypothetical protein
LIPTTVGTAVATVLLVAIMLTLPRLRRVADRGDDDHDPTGIAADD